MGEPVFEQSGERSAARLRGLLTEPTVPFLLAAFVVLVKRGYVPDIVIVGASILVIGVDSLRWGFRESEATLREWPPVRLPVRLRGLAVVVLAAVAMALLPRTSRQLDLAFALIGAVALWWAWLPGRHARTSAPVPAQAPPRWWLWWAPALLFCAVEVVSLAFQTAPRVDSPAHPSLSGVLEPALSVWPARAVALLIWFAAGWWLLRRVRSWAS